MKFTLLLFVLALKLRLVALFSSAFRKKLRKKDFTIAIRAADSERARTFRIEKGRVRSRAGRDPSVDTELLWRDTGTAIRTMLSSNELDAFSAIGRTELRVLGNFENALWFMELADQ